MRAVVVVGMLLALSSCKRAPDPEAAVRYAFVKEEALAHDAGAAWRLTSNDEIFFDDGWYPMELDKHDVHSEAWRWMGKSAILRVRTHDAPMKLVLTGWVPYDVVGAPPAMTLRWNGVRVDAFLAPPGHFTKEVLVSREMQAGAEWGNVLVETSTAGYPPGDPRMLGYALAEVRWEPAER